MATHASLSSDVWSNIAGLLLSTCRMENVLLIMDDASAELCHWAGAIDRFIDCAAVINFPIVNYQSFQSHKDKYQTSAFVLSNVFDEDTLEHIVSTLRNLKTHTCFLFVPYYTSINEVNIKDSETSAATTFRKSIQLRIESSVHFDVALKIHKVPLFHCSLCSGVITTPAFAKFSSVNDSTDKDSQWIECLGVSLGSLLYGLDVCEDIFSIGKTAHRLAGYMEASTDTQSRRKTAMYRGSLLLIDRSLDISTATSHSLDSLSESIFGLLPRIEGHSTDVAVDMSPVLPSVNQGCLLKGSIAIPGQVKNQRLLSTFFFRKQKEASMSLSRRLLEALSEESISVDTKGGRLGKAPVQQLQHLLKYFKENGGTLWRHHGLLQMSCAATQAICHCSVPQWEGLLSLEKVIALCLRENAVEDAFQQVILYVNEQTKQMNRDDSGSAVEDILGLCAYLYSLLGPDTTVPRSSQDLLESTLVEFFHQGLSICPKMLQGFKPGMSLSDTSIKIFVSSEVLSVLHRVQMARKDLRQFRKLIKSDTSESVQPLLVQVMEAVFSPSKPNLVDIVHHSQGLAGKLLQSSFSLFRSSAGPRPNSHPLLVVYVVGGITPGEIRRINEVVSNQSSKSEIIIGSSAILRPKDLISHLFTNRM